jgi:ABC-type transport system involved in multi-copper enzyme maturation permease subunit
MNSLPFAIRTVRWMVRDTFRQSLASKLFWVMLSLTALCSLFCLGISVTGDEQREKHPFELPLYMSPGLKGQGKSVLPGDGKNARQFDPAEELEKSRREGIIVPGGKVSLGFGLFKDIEITKSREDTVRLIQLWMAGVLADTVGVLLALLWTAGFLPTFLEPHAVTVLLAKPAPRWSLLAGKYLGVVLFVALHAVLFVAGTWFGIGLSTGVWDGAYWLAAPLLIINFAVFYAFSSFLAVCTRSTVVCVFGTLLFWILCWVMNMTHHHVVGNQVKGLTPVSSTLLEAGYWVLPKPLDASGVFFDAMRAASYSAPVPQLEAVKKVGEFYPELSIAASLLFAVAILGAAAFEFRKTDY